MTKLNEPVTLSYGILQDQRDELLEACKDLISYLSGRNTEDWETIDERARKAIAEAEEN